MDPLAPSPIVSLSRAIKDLSTECDLLHERFEESMMRFLSERSGGKVSAVMHSHPDEGEQKITRINHFERVRGEKRGECGADPQTQRRACPRFYE